MFAHARVLCIGGCLREDDIREKWILQARKLKEICESLAGRRCPQIVSSQLTCGVSIDHLQECVNLASSQGTPYLRTRLRAVRTWGYWPRHRTASASPSVLRKEMIVCARMRRRSPHQICAAEYLAPGCVLLLDSQSLRLFYLHRDELVCSIACSANCVD